ncbi:hypothetical protein [Polaromonas sp. YR568]|uniref:hypothetical protein n=1 Tax=Polaromonas sp. YR568 TaxID=1855301 RepID=UPI000B8358EE|nr:hypothetical protein [Polaromonas sp. YR568]
MRRLFAFEMVSAAAVITFFVVLGAHGVWSAFRTTPSFNSLQLISGEAIAVGDCTGTSRNGRDFVVKVRDADGDHSFRLPCVGDHNIFKKMVGTKLEVRTAREFDLFMQEYPEVWDVRSAKNIYYDYDSRAARQKQIGPYIGLAWLGFLVIVLVAARKFSAYARQALRRTFHPSGEPRR